MNYLTTLSTPLPTLRDCASIGRWRPKRATPETQSVVSLLLGLAWFGFIRDER